MNSLRMRIFFKRTLNRLGFLEGHDFSHFKDRRNVVLWTIIGIAILTVLTAYMVGRQHQTSYLEEEVNDLAEKNAMLQDEVTSSAEKIENLGSSLAKNQEYISVVQQNVTRLAGILEMQERSLELKDEQLKQMEEEHDRVLNEREDRIEQLEDANVKLSSRNSEFSVSNQKLNELLKNSIRAVCCSFSDIQQAAHTKWSIVGHQIVCSDAGDYTVECGTGLTDLPGDLTIN